MENAYKKFLKKWPFKKLYITYKKSATIHQ